MINKTATTLGVQIARTSPSKCCSSLVVSMGCTNPDLDLQQQLPNYAAPLFRYLQVLEEKSQHSLINYLPCKFRIVGFQ